MGKGKLPVIKDNPYQPAGFQADVVKAAKLYRRAPRYHKVKWHHIESPNVVRPSRAPPSGELLFGAGNSSARGADMSCLQRPDGGDGVFPPPGEEGPSQPRSSGRQTANARKQARWCAIQPELLFHSVAAQPAEGAEQERRANVAPRLEADLQQKLQSVLTWGCPCCSSPLQPEHLVQGNHTVRYCCLPGFIDIKWPSYQCAVCQLVRTVHPCELGAFPSTPDKASVWYSSDLLRLTHEVVKSGPFSRDAWQRTVQGFYKTNGFEVDGSALNNLGAATDQWWNIQLKMTDLHDGLGCDHISDGGWGCPCCWDKCRAICGDACMGFRRFSSAGAASIGIKPMNQSSPMMDEAEMLAALQSAKTSQPSQQQMPACASIKAAVPTPTMRASQVYDRTGLAAFACVHEIVIIMTSMFGPENFTYYSEMLRRLLSSRAWPPGTKLYIFLDMGCQFKAFWARYGAMCFVRLQMLPWLSLVCWLVDAAIPFRVFCMHSVRPQHVQS